MRGDLGLGLCLHFVGPKIQITFANPIARLDILSGPCLGCFFAPHLRAMVLPATSKPPPTSRRTSHCFLHLERAKYSYLPPRAFCLTNSSALEGGGIPSPHFPGESPFLWDPTTNVLPPLCLSPSFNSLDSPYMPSLVFSFLIFMIPT